MPLVDPVVGADPSSPRVRAPSSVSSSFDQVLLAALGRGVDHPAGLEAQAHPRDLPAADHRRQVEADFALDRVLDRAGEELAVGHVVVADAGDELASGDAELCRCRAP